jgi:crotonobetainyl-CoA:carnitine CoA-transferase CaiB-like acyl-CoA transferase
MSVTGEAGGIPQRVSTALSDITTGLVGSLAIVAALHGRSNGNPGCLVDVSLLDTDLALMGPRIASYLAGEPEPKPSGGRDSVIAVYQAFETQDRPIVVAVGNDSLWRRFCRVLELEDFGNDNSLVTNAGRREQRGRILPVIEERFRSQSASVWLGALREAGIPSSIIQSLSEVTNDPQVIARGSIQELDTGVKVVGPPWRISDPLAEEVGERANPPSIGEAGSDTRAVLSEAGLSDTEITSLLDQHVVFGPPPSGGHWSD